MFTSSVWFIPGQNSKGLPSAHRLLDLISHKPGCVCIVIIFISIKLNLISTLNPPFQLTADNLIESLQVDAIKLAITQLFLIQIGSALNETHRSSHFYDSKTALGFLSLGRGKTQSPSQILASISIA